MKIIIPAPTIKEVFPTVLNSIRAQGIEPLIVECSYDNEIPKRKRIFMAKSHCREIGLSSNDKHIAFNDSDIEHLKTDNFELLEAFLEKNKEFGAVSLARHSFPENYNIVYDKIKKNHVCSGCVLFTREGLEKVNFGLFDDISDCFSIGLSLAENNLMYGYINKELRIKHLHK